MKDVKKTLIDIIEVIAISILVALLCFKFVFISAQVNGTSMYPTLKDGDKGYSFIIKKNISINRFDICVIDSDKCDELLVKRIIGLPNETIEYKDNKLYINGEYYEEDFVNDDAITEDLTITLGDDEYFCLGDNRLVSRDSRYYGSFNKDEILSTGMFVFYPFSDFGVK